MKTTDPYPVLLAKCLPLIEHYRNDLLVHDRNALASFPGIPFIHFTRTMGSETIFLPPAGHASWPARNAQIPYLFGMADREHILAQILVKVKYPWENLRCVHYFDAMPNGHSRLVEIAKEQAVVRTEQYIASVRHAWRMELPSHRNLAAVNQLLAA